MASVNKVILLGNCGRDPEVRYAASGMAIANVALATSSRRKDKQSGETIEDTQWHRIVFYDRLAEIAGEYVKKGAPIYIEGRIKYGKFTDKDGVERNTVDIIATELQLLGSRQDSAGGQERRPAPNQEERPRQAAPQGANQSRNAPPPNQQQRRAPPASGGSGFDDMDDDIPFVTNSMNFDMTTSKQRKMVRYDY